MVFFSGIDTRDLSGLAFLGGGRAAMPEAIADMGGRGTRTNFYKSGLPCSMTSSDLTLNDGIPPSPGRRATALLLSLPPL
ncbi:MULTISPECIES: hypothetical protein [Cupriavidus]|uniref:hypothetical protein n=1 Tax=Cupriavidus sp. DF5525 TaxID=3160989 RepID=UPI0003B06987|nr:hypothetical protein N234_36770 [Ralstonia pickettii DTP0602]